MFALPPEIWDAIFAFACTDDGSTGRALALTSHWTHTLSAPYTLQSLEACSARELLPLAAMLEARPPARRRVRHLTLTDRTTYDFAWGGRVVQRLAGVGAHADPEHTAADAFAHASAMKRVLLAAAPTLRTLTLDVSHALGFPPSLVPVRLPALTELTLAGLRCPFPVDAPACPLPRLRRLRIVNWGNKVCGNNIAVLEDIPAVAPELECLLISGFGAFDCRSVVLTLAATICAQDADRAAQFANLRVVLAPAPEPAQIEWLTGHTDGETLEVVKRMAQDIGHGRFVIG